MATVRLQDSELTNIGNAIRGKLGTTTQYLPSEMAPAILTIPKYEPWSWGNETEVGAGDAKWWADLKTWITSVATDEELVACVGKKKNMTLTEPYLNITSIDLICIGANQDGPKTLTFQTAVGLQRQSSFAPTESQCTWDVSKIRNTACAGFYNVLPGKDSVKTLKKGFYKDATTLAYIDDNVWIASYCELGGTGGVFGDNEWTLGGSQTPYLYYTTGDVNTKRIRVFGYREDHRAIPWFSRSRSSKYVRDYFYGVNTDGSLYAEMGGLGSGGVVPCFTIG